MRDRLLPDMESDPTFAGLYADWRNLIEMIRDISEERLVQSAGHLSPARLAPAQTTLREMAAEAEQNGAGDALSAYV